MTTTLIVPAAGAGTRLNSPLPKFLTPVAGKPMLAHLLELYRGVAGRVIVVVGGSALDQARRRFGARDLTVTFRVQEAPTGMLDAILIPADEIASGPTEWIWVTWCDQVAIHPATVAKLCDECASQRDALMVMPTARQREPYVHLDRDAAGHIVRILHRRERDRMPEIGESDAGLFALSRETYLSWLPEFAAGRQHGASTGERNFLPFIPWLDARRPGTIRTFPCRDVIESLGINTPGDLRRVESYLVARDVPASTERP